MASRRGYTLRLQRGIADGRKDFIGFPVVDEFFAQLLPDKYEADSYPKCLPLIGEIPCIKSNNGTRSLV